MRTIQISIDDKGRIQIPPVFQKDLGYFHGTKITVKKNIEGDIYLDVIKNEPELIIKDGVLVVRGESDDEIHEYVKDEHDRNVLQNLRNAGYENII